MNVQAASPNQGRFRLSGLVQSQEAVVFALAAAMFIVMAIGLPRFLTAGNISALLFNMSIIGVLGCGMAMVVIGQGIDLSMVAILAVTSALLVQLLIGGMPLWQALLVEAALRPVRKYVVISPFPFTFTFPRHWNSYGLFFRMS